MESPKQHFSHHHPLLFHQVPHGSQTHCSGCKSPASGNVYGCWQCSYFLHERAPSTTPLIPFTLKLWSLFLLIPPPLSSATLAALPEMDSPILGEFDLHLHCALLVLPNPNPHQSQDYNIINAHPQDLIYPPIQNAAIPSYPPQSPTTTNHPLPNNPSPIQTHNHCTNPPPAAPQTLTPNNPQSEPLNIIKHFSHPHALKQMEIEAENANICSACELRLSGSAYCCTERYCTFSLHKYCFDSPRELRHKSHPHHPLTLLPSTNGTFTCGACRKSGKAFAYTCSTCSHDLHIDCIRWPETVTRPDHEHTLALYYKSPFAEESGEVVFHCRACAEAADDKAWGWVYYCRECDFGTHLECVNSEMKAQNAGESIAEELMRLQQQKMNLDFQMQMAKQHAEFMTSIANSWKNFF